MCDESYFTKKYNFLLRIGRLKPSKEKYSFSLRCEQSNENLFKLLRINGVPIITETICDGSFNVENVFDRTFTQRSQTTQKYAPAQDLFKMIAEVGKCRKVAEQLFFVFEKLVTLIDNSLVK
jgi:hypothetical protein